MRIQHNIMAMNAYRNLGMNNSRLSKNLEKLASGYRINRAGDDAAGLAISEKMRAQISGLDQAQKNAQSGINLVQTAEGALTEVHDMLNRMVTLSTQAANGTYSDTDRDKIQSEVNALKDEINRIADSANFNGQKLLNGDLEVQQSVTDVQTHSQVVGMTINENTPGAGAPSGYTLDISKVFGTGDKVVIQSANNKVGTNGTKTLSFKNAGETLSAGDFTGNTVEEQAESIYNELKKDLELANDYDIALEGSKITFTAKTEGEQDPAKALTFSATSNVASAVSGAQSKAGAEGTATMANGGWNNLFAADNAASGLDLKEGDVLTFSFTGANSEVMTATVKVTADMIGDDVAETTTNIVSKLNASSFDDTTSTVADESRLLVSDFFTITGNKKNDGTALNGSVQVDAKLAGAFAVGSVTLTRDGTTANTIAGTAGTTTGTNDATDAAKNVYTVQGSATNQGNTDKNLSKGDKITLGGVLTDGRSFSVTMEAGKDFDIKADYNATMDELATKLQSADVKVKIGDEEVAANEIFGATKEFAIDSTAANGELTFTSTKAGKVQTGISGAVTSFSMEIGGAGAITDTTVDGVAQSAASSSITLDDQIGYGSAIEFNGKVYELVQNSFDVTSRTNEAIVVEDLSSVTTDELATMFKDAIVAKDTTLSEPGAPTVTVDGSTIKFTSGTVGSDSVAPAVSSPYGNTIDTTTFKFDADEIAQGTTFGLNGKTYEFVKTGENAKGDNVAIQVDDFKTATAKSLADAFKNAAKDINMDDIAEDGTITLKNSLDENGILVKHEFSMGGGMDLQIGDTSDAYNRMNVGIDDMHVAALGLNELDISTIEGAKKAVDDINAAINKVSATRGDLGAYQNRLEHTINNLGVMEENIQDAEANIRDTDIADEMMAYTKNNILIQSAQAMLAQANQAPQGVLQLMG